MSVALLLNFKIWPIICCLINSGEKNVLLQLKEIFAWDSQLRMRKLFNNYGSHFFLLFSKPAGLQGGVYIKRIGVGTEFV